MVIKDWAALIGVHHTTIHYRLKKGLPLGDALSIKSL